MTYIRGPLPAHRMYIWSQRVIRALYFNYILISGSFQLRQTSALKHHFSALYHSETYVKIIYTFIIESFFFCLTH